MTILNTIPQVKEYFADGLFDWAIWRRYASACSPFLRSKCEEDARNYDFETDMLPVIEYALENRGRLDALCHLFDSVTGSLSQHISDLFDAEPALTVILYLGLCNGAGWATTLGGEDAVLLGAEKIIELDWDKETDLKGLIFHEIGHIWHKHSGKRACSANSLREKSVLQLYDEGVAMVCEQILAGNDRFFHQDKADWLSWCVSHEKPLRSEYLLRLEQEKSTQDFFGDWCSFQGHSDTGYFLGCQFIKRLCQKFSLNEIAALPYSVLEAELIGFLRS